PCRGGVRRRLFARRTRKFLRLLRGPASLPPFASRVFDPLALSARRWPTGYEGANLGFRLGRGYGFQRQHLPRPYCQFTPKACPLRVGHHRDGPRGLSPGEGYHPGGKRRASSTTSDTILTSIKGAFMTQTERKRSTHIGHLQIILFTLMVALGLPGLALAQVDQARITGAVRDQNNAVVPGATITIKNERTGDVRTATV